MFIYLRGRFELLPRTNDIIYRYARAFSLFVAFLLSKQQTEKVCISSQPRQIISSTLPLIARQNAELINKDPEETLN